MNLRSHIERTQWPLALTTPVLWSALSHRVIAIVAIAKGRIAPACASVLWPERRPPSSMINEKEMDRL